MSTLVVSKNCPACNYLKENTDVYEKVDKVVDVAEADEKTIDKLINNEVLAVPALIKDNGEVCTGVHHVAACVLEMETRKS